MFQGSLKSLIKLSHKVYSWVILFRILIMYIHVIRSCQTTFILVSTVHIVLYILSLLTNKRINQTSQFDLETFCHPFHPQKQCGSIKVFRNEILLACLLMDSEIRITSTFRSFCQANMLHMPSSPWGVSRHGGYSSYYTST